VGVRERRLAEAGRDGRVSGARDGGGQIVHEFPAHSLTLFRFSMAAQ
jgi:hypothetical protein